MRLRRMALTLAVAALVAVAALALVVPAVQRGPSRVVPRAGDPLPTADLTPAAEHRAGASWARIRVGSRSYAVPPAWSRQPAEERVAYREDGAVIAAGRGRAVLSAEGCPVAWAVLADPVRSTNARGVAEATALAWARGYAGLPMGSGLAASRAEPLRAAAGQATRAWRSRVEVDLGDDSGCAGERAELTAVAQPSGTGVVTLIVARYLGVPGAPSDATYAGVVGSLSVE